MTVRILTGDARERLKDLPADSVDCVVTSPPYWGLRDYGTGQWVGGDPGCDHLGPPLRTNNKASNGSRTFHGGASRGTEPWQNGECGKCGAVKVDSQFGLEPTWQEHVDGIVSLFREVRRILKPTGTLWLNYGDSYATSINGRSAADTKAIGEDDRTFRDKPFSTVQGVLKPKDLCGIPWRVAFALQADGWWLRQDIIWSKPNPMPESITDRCTKAHEYIFLLSKSARYYFDAEAIAEPGAKEAGSVSVKTWGYEPESSDPKGGGMRGEGGLAGRVNMPTRNKRSVWEIATQPFSEAHFATFPPALVEPCIKAGCPEKACAKCGAPWVREVELGEYNKTTTRGKQARASVNGQRDNYGGYPVRELKTLGFSPSCSCGVETVPGVVLDPFGGAGTTGLVADRLGRNAILIELNPQYAELARKRVYNDLPMFVDVAAE